MTAVGILVPPRPTGTQASAKLSVLVMQQESGYATTYVCVIEWQLDPSAMQWKHATVMSNATVCVQQCQREGPQGAAQ